MCLYDLSNVYVSYVWILFKMERKDGKFNFCCLKVVLSVDGGIGWSEGFKVMRWLICLICSNVKKWLVYLVMFVYYSSNTYVMKFLSKLAYAWLSNKMSVWRMFLHDY